MKPISNLSELQLVGDVLEVDTQQDAWEYGPPPVKGNYKLKLFPAKDAWSQGLINPKDPASIFLQCALECRIVSDDDEIDNIPVFARVSSKMGRGKDTSTMAGLIVKLGHEATLKKLMADKKLNHLMLGKVLEAALKKEPIADVQLDWRGSYSYTDKKGDEQWDNPCKRMEDFPLDHATGKRKHIFYYGGKDGSSHEIRAQLSVLYWYGKGEALKEVVIDNKVVGVKELGGSNGLVSAPRPQLVQPIMPQVVPQLVTPNQVAQQVAQQPVQQPVQQSMFVTPVVAQQVQPAATDDELAALLAQ